MQKRTTLVISGAKSVHSRAKLRLRLITRNCNTVKKSALPKTLLFFLCMRVFTERTSKRKGLWTPWLKNLQSSRRRMSSGEAPRQATMPGQVEMAAIAWETRPNSARAFPRFLPVRFKKTRTSCPPCQKRIYRLRNTPLIWNSSV